MTQSVQLTAFGSVLNWVCANLKQIEAEMATNPLKQDAKQDVINARESLETLLSNDQALRGDYRNIQEAEYAALVKMLQKREIEITDEIANGAKDMLAQVGQDYRYSPSMIDLAKRAIDKIRGI